MMRIAQETLDELIEYRGQLKNWPLNAEGVLKLALDLQDTRARVAELEKELEELGNIADGVRADVRRIRENLAPTLPVVPDALAAFEADYPPGQRRKHRKRVPRT